MKKLEKRMRAEHAKATANSVKVSWETFIQIKYDEAIKNKQFVLANEIQSLTTVELDK